MSPSRPATGGEGRWTWVARTADAYSLISATGSAILVTVAFLAPGLNRRATQVLLAGLTVMVVGGALLIRALIERGDPMVACDPRRNRRLTLRLWSGVALALGGTAVWIPTVVALGS
ncbi:hypothetical protein [Actinoplanes subtropicus]|uniref:hypothetical protein n=1 Tax=Actinoplanes subtropicus TaxID=543632 RepID=UPI0004C34F9D|nr:hypothetical protein [Actinoplanes subtropicus]